MDPDRASHISHPYRPAPLIHDAVNTRYTPIIFQVVATWFRSESTTDYGPAPDFPSTRVSGPDLFRYAPLEQSEIRLVKLHPPSSTTIDCELYHFSLYEAPSFTAISYAWGDIGDTRMIKVNRVVAHITASLHGALEALQDEERHVWIWADALCIDQQNQEEKSRQLRLITKVYNMAESVAIWLGPEKDNSTLATEFLKDLYYKRAKFRTPDIRQKLEAVMSLFERGYWDRLWVVQEVFYAKQITVYCGSTQLGWEIYRTASAEFYAHRPYLESFSPGGLNAGQKRMWSRKQLTCSQVLLHEGPESLLCLEELEEFYSDRNRSFQRIPYIDGKYINSSFGVLLKVMRRLRRKLSGEPRDKVFGILGVLPASIRRQIQADYSLSVKTVYTNVVEFLLDRTGRLDVICECIYFPRHTSSISLPSWVPDWSYIPDINALGASFEFSAGGECSANSLLHKLERPNKLHIYAVYLGVVKDHGIAVGALCRLGDYLMAFLHWRTLLLDEISEADEEKRDRALRDFCLTLSLGQQPVKQQELPSSDWVDICYHVFASLINDRLPKLALDEDLFSHITSSVDLGDYGARRQFLQQNFGSRMMGRCFCMMDGGLMGMGSGFMESDDIVVVPFGCSTPIILRPEGDEFRFVGDIYIHGYMQGKAIKEEEEGQRECRRYILH